MTKVATLLCLLALAAAQVPFVACANGCPEAECRDVIVSAAHGHDCDAHSRHERHSQRAHAGRAHGHHHGHGHCSHRHGAPREETPTEPEPHSHGTVHEVLQNLVVQHDHRFEMPEHTRSVEDDVLLSTPVEPPARLTVLEAAHRAEPDPVPVPPPASVRLLL